MRRRTTPLSHLLPRHTMMQSKQSKKQNGTKASGKIWQRVTPPVSWPYSRLAVTSPFSSSPSPHYLTKGVHFPCFAGMYAGWCNFIFILWFGQRLELAFVTRIGQCDQIGAESLCLGVNGSRLQRLSPFLGWTDFTVTELNHFSSDPSLFFLITVTGEVTTQKPICW